MKLVNCYNCGLLGSSFYASENGYTLVKCDTCGLLYVNPRPSDEEITQAHRVGKHRGVETIDVVGKFNSGRIIEHKQILNDIFGNEVLASFKTWLDIGCGHGELLLALQQLSKGKILAKGLEPNLRKQKSAQNRGLDVSYFNLDSHSDQYDIISFLNVYSHLPDPPKTIVSWKQLLKPGGELFIETGNTAKLDSKDHYRPFFLPDHLSFASEEIIVGILERTGFEVISIKKRPFIKADIFSSTKELIKIFWPNRKSRIKYVLNYKKYSDANMYIRARLIN